MRGPKPAPIIRGTIARVQHSDHATNTTIDTGRVELADRRLEYVRIAPAVSQATPIVLLHEGLGCVALWREFPARLAEATGREVVVYSRRGYGRSSPVALPRTNDYLEGDGRRELNDVLDALAVDEAIPIGHSDGATIALAAAAHDTRGRFPAIAAMAPHVFVESISREAVRAVVARYETGDLRARLARHHGDNVEGAFRGWSDTWLRADFADWDITASLAGIRCPTLVVQGSNDAYGSSVHMRRIAAAVAGPCRCRLLARCGHIPHAERSQTTLAVIARFLEGID